MVQGMGKIVTVKPTSKAANPEFAKELERAMEGILRGEYVTLEELKKKYGKTVEA